MLRKIGKAVIYGSGLYGLHYFPKTYDFIEHHVYLPIARKLPAEVSHKCALWATKCRVPPYDDFKSNTLKTRVFGIDFDNPIGLAAGFDKDCEAIKGCRRLGFGFVEVGSITARPQYGNEKPRVFTLPEDNAIINRYGFPSKGYDVARKNLHNQLVPLVLVVPEIIKEEDLAKDVTAKVAGTPHPIVGNSGAKEITVHFPKFLSLFTQEILHFCFSYFGESTCVTGINLGLNKTSKNPLNDYLMGIKDLGVYSDYIVINISSPNTPGLRDLQRRHKLERMLLHINGHMSRTKKNSHGSSCKALLVKISPDLSDEHLEEIITVAQNPKYGINGLIISNTTVSRAGLSSAQKHETGGLSGQPLKQLSTNMIRKVYKISRGSIPIVGVGGIENADDAYEKIRAGASLVQLYTGLVYEGLGCVRRMKLDLIDLLHRDGYSNVQEAVGVDVVLPLVEDASLPVT